MARKIGLCTYCMLVPATHNLYVGGTFPTKVCEAHIPSSLRNKAIPIKDMEARKNYIKPERSAYDFPNAGPVQIFSEYAATSKEYLLPWDNYNLQRWIQFLNIEIHIFGVWP